MSVNVLKKKYQVVVIGGGMSGVCAAIAAARHGAKTVLIQNRSMFGGNASSEIRMHILGAGCHMSKSNLNETGILMEILLENKYRNPRQNFPVWDTVLWEKVKFQENLDFFLNTNMDGVETEGGHIRSILCHQNSTETEISVEGELFVDATGHGTLGKMAGAGYMTGTEGREAFGEPNAPELPNDSTNGNTLMFKAVKREKAVPFIKPFWAYDFSEEDLRHRLHASCKAAFSDGGALTGFEEGDSENLPEIANMDSGYWWIELGGQYNDIIAQGEEIRDELLRCVYGVWDHIKNKPGHGADCYELDWVGIVPGYRESRRLIGEYILTEQDVRANRLFPDAVAYGGWPMDEHVREGIFAFDSYPSRIFNFPGVYTIPYRCYVSRDVDNLFMAGRDISVSKMAFGSTRVMATCAIGGQAVGTAAALCLKHGVSPSMLGRSHIGELQQTLIKDDCYIPGVRREDPADIAPLARISADSAREGYEPCKVVNGIPRTVGEESNCWESITLPGRLTLTLEGTKKLSRITLLFDPDLTQEIMPSISAMLLDRQPQDGVSPVLVRDYELILWRGEELIYRLPVFDNYQRVNTLEIPGSPLCDRIELQVSKTHGYPSARVFEVRLYS